jgi:hypothetical protein
MDTITSLLIVTISPKNGMLRTPFGRRLSIEKDLMDLFDIFMTIDSFINKFL